MRFSHWLRSLAARPNRAPARRAPHRPTFRPRLEALEDRLTPSTGGLLDPTFGSGGEVLSSFTSYNTAVAVQPDGKIVIAGNFGVARYNADGSLDTGFGSGGHTATNFGVPDAVALQPQADGTDKIVVPGMQTVKVKGKYLTFPALARYNANGTLDATFGNNGEEITNVEAVAMVVDGSGRIVVYGGDTLARYTPNGTLDSSFGSGGELVTSIRIAEYGSLAIQPDGKIVLACDTPNPTTNNSDFLVARFNPNGTADSGFGTGGVATTHVGVGDDGFGGLAIQGDGKIVIDGRYNSPAQRGNQLCMLRYNADGTLDATFATGGVGLYAEPDGQVASFAPQGSGIAVQANGEIVACGLCHNLAGNSFAAVLRVNPDGSVDTGYGNGGWAITGNNAINPQASALEPDGRFLLVGQSGTDVAMVRFLPSAPQIGSFLASPNPVTSGSSTTLTASNITDGNPNSTVTQVAFYAQVNGANTLLGYGTQTSPGVWTFNYTVNLAPGTYTLFAQAQDSYGALGDPLGLTLQVM